MIKDTPYDAEAAFGAGAAAAGVLSGALPRTRCAGGQICREVQVNLAYRWRAVRDGR